MIVQQLSNWICVPKCLLCLPNFPGEYLIPFSDLLIVAFFYAMATTIGQRHLPVYQVSTPYSTP